ncbi:hypothetical protein [Actinoplanes awajinensis]|uniref:Tetratricopeptide repeat protein n=1 Tax=Actinoplanes awajinensis subsp. mycoplanecinus TaxID=135947 RepID=A0A101J7E1_9ACTN|nr:hypothetical protein [Actinoplanes awajinensis]KUL21586.1 hypothetical protein ADL15_50350 [Actinoplanes awajinensis subsp. mycoplanecinus]
MDADGLRPLIIAFVQLGTREELAMLVRARPELLTAEADDAFGELQAEWARAGSPLAGGTAAHRRILRTMRAAMLSSGTRADDPEVRATAWTQLGHLRLDHYQATGAPESLAEAESAYRSALEVPRPGRLSHLAAALLHRWRHHGDADALDEAVRLSEQAAPGNPVALNNLGSALLELYQRDGGDALDRAVAAFAEALRLDTPGTPDYRITQANLSAAQLQVDDSVADARAALDAATPVQRPGALDNLGTALSRWYDETGDVQALEQLVAAYEEAVATTPPHSPRRPIRRANLGDALRDRYLRIGTRADLDRAVDLLDEALRLTPARSPSHRDRLAASAVARLQRSGPGDLAVAADRAQAALAATPQDSPDRSARLGLVAACLQKLGAWEPAVALFQESLDATSQADPRYARHLHNLGQAIGPHDRDTAERLLHEAWRTGAARDPAAAVSAGLAAGILSSDDGDQAGATRGYLRSLAAVSALVVAQHHRRAKEGWLREAQGVPARAAGALLRRGLPAEAVLVLESGRAALLTEQLRRVWP